MTASRFLSVALPAAGVIALISLVLPASASSFYFQVLQPVSLVIGSLLALYASAMYRRALKATFVFLSGFLFIYCLANILFTNYKDYLGDYDVLAVLIVQIINYSLLILFCVNLLKVITIRQLNKSGWVVAGVTIVLSLFVAIYPEWSLMVDAVSGRLLAAAYPLLQRVSYISYLTIRMLDAALIIVLVPVVWLYIQFLKSRQKQSLTFTVVILGIVCATLLDYAFQAIVHAFPQLLARESHLYTAIPNALYLYGYLVIAAGLYAHNRQDEWGFKAIEKALG